jgi:hypothetical protein
MSVGHWRVGQGRQSREEVQRRPLMSAVSPS